MSKPCDPKFRGGVEKRVEIAIQEIMDGCRQCEKNGYLCSEHAEQGYELTLHPKVALARHEAQRIASTER